MRQKVSSGEPFENVYGYSRAVQVGDHIHVSGTTARPPDLDGDTYRQARAALSIIETALQEVGSSLADVVRTVTYVMDIDDAELVARAHSEVFGDVRPRGHPGRSDRTARWGAGGDRGVRDRVVVTRSSGRTGRGAS